MPNIINEGTLRFTFPDSWLTVKYDDTEFYRKNLEPAGSKLKAVDILAVPLDRKGNLILIEIKDFRGYARQNKNRIESGELTAEVIEKAMHTLAALYLVKYCGIPELTDFVGNNLTPPQKIELILFMEEDNIRDENNTRGKLARDNRQKRIDDITFSFRRKLKKKLGIIGKVINTASIKARDEFTVELM